MCYFVALMAFEPSVMSQVPGPHTFPLSAVTLIRFCQHNSVSVACWDPKNCCMFRITRIPEISGKRANLFQIPVERFTFNMRLKHNIFYVNCSPCGLHLIGKYLAGGQILIENKRPEPVKIFTLNSWKVVKIPPERQDKLHANAIW